MTTLVVIASRPDGGADYTRYVGRKPTHKGSMQGMRLPAAEVENFRSQAS